MTWAGRKEPGWGWIFTFYNRGFFRKNYHMRSSGGGNRRQTSNEITGGLRGYAGFLKEVKSRIRAVQVQATLSVNRELIQLYWDVGRAIAGRQERDGWGSAVIPRLAGDIQNAIPEVKGFSERNIGRMIAFYRAYSEGGAILPQAVAKLGGRKKLPQAVAKIPAARHLRTQANEGALLSSLAMNLPWGHNVMLMEKFKELADRRWYMEQTIEHGWSRSLLEMQIDAEAHRRAGKAVHNFHRTLPPPQSELAEQMLKDPYVFDFLTLSEPFRERELEVGLLLRVEKFLLELGQGFAFVGRQMRFEVGNEDFYLDLLFYHLRLRCFVIVDLKKGAFKADYTGKMNFYCNMVDDQMRHASDQPSVGLILCQDKNRIVADYSLKGINKSIGISAYRLRMLEKELQSSLPSLRDVERGLARGLPAKPTRSIQDKK